MLHNSVTNAMPVILVNSLQEYMFPRYRAAAPEMISINSLVMTACRVLLKVKVNLSIISPGNRKLKCLIKWIQINSEVFQKEKQISILWIPQNLLNTNFVWILF